MSYHRSTTEAAKGKWRGILLELGVPSTALTGKHGPCPMCGGKDRFRWINREGSGDYFCSGCGSDSGMGLAKKFTRLEFAECASRIDAILGNVKPDAPPRPSMTDDDRRAALRRLYAESAQMVPGDLADRYLAARKINQPSYPPALRYAPSVRDGEGGTRPCMIAVVGLYGEKPATLHRTFLRPDGTAKAEMAAPRKLMPGDLPPGACVQLSEWNETGPLGIAEGIETALAASAIFDIPVWAAINAGNLPHWQPPPGCEEVVIFGDHDPKYAGQAAAYTLAHKLACKGMPVSVQIPVVPGLDWADERMRRG